MNCYCGKGKLEGVAETVCIKCKQSFHKTCFQETKEKGFFYCELCILEMMEPLVSNQVDVEFRELSYDKGSIVTVPIMLSEEQFSKLSSKSLYLNMFLISPGEIEPEAEELNLYIGGASVTMQTDRFNCLNWQAITRNYRMRHRNQDRHVFNISLTLSPFKGLKGLYITLASMISETRLFEDVFSRKASKITGNEQPLSLKKMVTISKGKSVPVAVSVKCPLTMILMAYPGKGVHCKHAEFFCVKSFIMLNLKKDTRELKWKCPICKSRVFFNELFLDDMMQEEIKRHTAYFNDADTDDLDDDEVLDQRPNQDRPPLPEKQYKLYVMNGEILTPDQLDLLLKPQKHSTRTINGTSSKLTNETWARILGKPELLPLSNPNSEANHMTKEYQWIEIPSSPNKISPNKSMTVSGEKVLMLQPIEPQLIQAGPLEVSTKFQKTSKSEKMISEPLDKPSQRKSSITKGDTLVKKLTTQKSPLIEEESANSESKFEKFSSSSSKIEDELTTPLLFHLRAVPDRAEWVKNFLKEYTNSRSLLQTIMEAPNNIRNVTDQLYLISTGVNKFPVKPDILIKFGWFISQNIDPYMTPRHLGEIFGSLCSLFKEQAGLGDLFIEYLREREVLPSSVGSLIRDSSEPVSSKLERIAQFVFGWAMQVCPYEEEKCHKEPHKVTLEKALTAASGLLRAIFRGDLEQETVNKDADKLRIIKRARQLCLMSTSRILAQYLLFSGSFEASAEVREFMITELVRRAETETAAVDAATADN